MLDFGRILADTPMWPASNSKEGVLSYLNAIWKLFTSVKLSVILLLTLAGTSVIGTLIPQKQDPEKYYGAYGDFWYRFLETLHVFDMYAAPWFQLLLVMITINIIICSTERLSANWRIIFVKTPNFSLSRFRGLSDAVEFTSKLSQRRLAEICEPVVRRGFEYSRVEEIGKGFAIFAERFRWSRLGVYTVHLSVVLLLLGALIGSRFGFDGYVNIPEGDTIDRIRQYNSNTTIPLGFEVRCDDYAETYYDTGTPKEFRSKLTILEDGQPVLQKDIVVNDPLRYRGVNLFQSSRGKMDPLDLTLSFTFRDTGSTYRKKVKLQQEIVLPEEAGKLVVRGYQEHYGFRGQDLGEAVLATYSPREGKPISLVLPSRYPAFDEMRNGEFSVSLSDLNHRYFTGLQVTRDPGVWVVYSGFIVIILGCYITLFISHQQICVEIAKSGNKSRVMIAGRTDGNRLGITRRIEKISEKLRKLAENAEDASADWVT